MPLRSQVIRDGWKGNPFWLMAGAMFGQVERDYSESELQALVDAFTQHAAEGGGGDPPVLPPVGSPFIYLKAEPSTPQIDLTKPSSATDAIGADGKRLPLPTGGGVSTPDASTTVKGKALLGAAGGAATFERAEAVAAQVAAIMGDGNIEYGSGAPGSGIGINGDSYVDTAATPPRLYGPKAGGTWPSGFVLLGSTVASVMPTATKTANYTAAGFDQVPVDATAGSVAVTLPTSASAGTVVEVKKLDATRNGVVVTPPSGETIDGASTFTIRDRNFARVFRKGTGTAWIMSSGLTTTGGIGNVRLDRMRDVYVPDNTALLNFRKAVARMRNGGKAARVLVRGDSTVYGVLSGNNPTNLVRRDYIWYSRARQILAVSGDVGRVEESIFQLGAADDTRFTYGTGWSGPTWTAGATGKMTFTEVTGGHDAFDLLILKQGGAPSIVVTIDGTNFTVDLSAQANNTVAEYRLPIASTIPHVLQIGASATGTGTIVAVEPVTIANNGMKIGGLGVSGQTLRGINPQVTTVGNNMFNILGAKPDLVVLRIGINDMRATSDFVTGAATYKADLTAFVSAFQAQGTDVVIEVFPSYNSNQSGAPGTYESALFHQAIYEVADELICTVIDLQRRWGYGVAATTGAATTPATASAMYDGTHDTLLGNHDGGAVLADFLGAVARSTNAAALPTPAEIGASYPTRAVQQDMVGSGYGMRGWFAKLAARDFEPVDVAMIGDSIYEGEQLTNLSWRIPDRLADQIRQKYPVAGQEAIRGNTYFPFLYAGTAPRSGSPFVHTGTGTTNNNPGFLSRTIDLDSSGKKVVGTFPGASTSTKIHYQRTTGTGIGTFYYKIDGGAPVNVDVSNGGTATDYKGVVSVTFDNTGSPASHTVEVGWVSGVARMAGVSIYQGNETKGVRVWDGGRSGYAMLGLVQNLIEIDAFMAIVKPSLILTDMLGNDYQAGRTPAQLLADYTTFRNRVTAQATANAIPDPPIVVTAPYKAGVAGDTEAYKAAIKPGLAALPNVYLLDLGFRLPPVTGDVLGLFADILHPTRRGAAMITDVVADAVTFHE